MGARGWPVAAGALLLCACGAPAPSSAGTATAPASSTTVAAPTASETPFVDPVRLHVTNDRDVGYQGFTVTLAGAPYECLQSQIDPTDGLDSLVPCSSLVHARGPGYDDDWLASNGAFLATEDPLKGKSLAKATSTVLEGFLNVYYPTGYARPTTMSAGSYPVAGAKASYRLLVRIPFHLKGLATTSDSVEIVVIKLTSGRYVGWWSVLPNDADPVNTTEADASRRTLAVRG